MFNTLNDARNLGISKNKLTDILEDRLTKTETDLLLRGNLKIPSYSKEAFEALNARLKREDPINSYKIIRQNNALQDIFDGLYNKLERTKLDVPIEELDNRIEELLSPKVKSFRGQPTRSTTPISAAPRVELPSQITGAPVNAQILTSSQQGQPGQQFATASLGQRYNLLPTSAERSEFLDRVVSV